MLGSSLKQQMTAERVGAAVVGMIGAGSGGFKYFNFGYTYSERPLVVAQIPGCRGRGTGDPDEQVEAISAACPEVVGFQDNRIRADESLFDQPDPVDEDIDGNGVVF